MSPDPIHLNTSPMKIFWISFLCIAVLGGFGAFGYIMLKGSNATIQEDNIDSPSTSPASYLSNLMTAHQKASKTLSNLPNRTGLENVSESPISDRPIPDKLIADPISHPAQKKSLKGYGDNISKLFQTKSFRLDGVITGNPLRVMINRQIVFVGEEVDGARVVQATSQEIVLDYKGKEYTLKLGETIKP